MSGFSYAYKPGFKPEENRARKAKQVAQAYYNKSSSNAQRAIALRRNNLGLPPLSSRGFGSMTFAANRERKYFDHNPAAYTVDAAGGFKLLHLPVLGSDYNNRIGRKTIVKSLYIRGYIALKVAVLSTTASTVAQSARLIIFIDNQPNGALPAATDLLVQARPEAQLNPNYRDRFRVIKDKVFVYDPYIRDNTNHFAAMNRTIYPIKCYKKLNLETIFNGTNGGTIGDINSGALYMFYIADQVSPDDITMYVSTRVRFDDA